MLTCWLIITKRKANMSVIYRMSGIIRKESIKFKVRHFLHCGVSGETTNKNIKLCVHYKSHLRGKAYRNKTAAGTTLPVDQKEKQVCCTGWIEFR
jgi:hypothetical protein